MHHALARVRQLPIVALMLVVVGCNTDVTTPRSLPPAPPLAEISTSAVDFSDGAGKAWRQPIATTSLSWTQVATACPRDGLSPCAGVVSGKDLTGWVWASEAQVAQLFSLWAPEILIDRNAAAGNLWAGIGLTNVFTPTQWFANTYQSSTYVGGWTSSTDSSGAPIAGGGGWSTPPHAGGVSIGPVANPNQGSSARGVFMWRADGSDGRGIVATDDAGAVDAPAGGVAVVDILANDLLAGNTATTGEVTITQLSSSNAGVALDVLDGSVDVASGTPVGAATLTYRICETANPSNCATASVAVTIDGNLIDAQDDAGSATTRGGVALADVRTNDSFGVAVSLHQVSVSDAGLSLDVADGSVDVAPGTAAGVHTLVYRLCETASPTNCASATVTITVTNLVIDAVNDAGGAASSTGGVAVANVLANDRLDGAPATLATVDLSLVSSTAPGITLDLGDGSVDVQPLTAGVVHSLTYRICERAAPSNCDVATVTVSVAPQSIVVSRSSFTLKEGVNGTFTVRLSQPPVGSVVVSPAYHAGTSTATVAPATITFNGSNWNVPVTVTVKAPKDSDKVDNAFTVHLTAPGVATVAVVVKVLDTNRSLTNPVPSITAPLNGQTVSGLVDFTGTGTDSNGTTVEGRFSVDGNRIYTDKNSTGSYRVVGRWNSATVANGWHTLELRITDNSGADGRMTIRVLVSN
jgi:hypothetical protein